MEVFHCTDTECHLPWDHTVLPATRRKWTHPALTPAMQAGTLFIYPGGMAGWVDPVDLIAPRPGVEPATFRSRVQRSTNATTKPTEKSVLSFLFVGCSTDLGDARTENWTAGQSNTHRSSYTSNNSIHSNSSSSANSSGRSSDVIHRRRVTFADFVEYIDDDDDDDDVIVETPGRRGHPCWWCYSCNTCSRIWYRKLVPETWVSSVRQKFGTRNFQNTADQSNPSILVTCTQVPSAE